MLSLDDKREIKGIYIKLDGMMKDVLTILKDARDINVYAREKWPDQQAFGEFALEFCHVEAKGVLSSINSIEEMLNEG